MAVTNIIKGQIRRVKNWRRHLFNLSLQTFIRLKIICECLRDGDLCKRNIGKYLFKLQKLTFLPYDWTKEYKKTDIKVFREDDYPYVYHKGKKLYFPKEWTVSQCSKYYLSIIQEQDTRSPHKYLNEARRRPGKDDIVADIGAAEGNFSLEVVDDIKKIYIFESDEKWIAPLLKTFSRYGEKVEIVKKYIGNKVGKTSTTIDDFFEHKEITFIKADIEGAELSMLRGGAIVLKHKIHKVLLCTYHKPNDEIILRYEMENYGFECSFNDGYVLYMYDRETFKPPYVRKCLMYCEKSPKSMICHSRVN